MDGDGLGDACDLDVDGDGSDTTLDCNDFDNTIFPGATEVGGDNIDQDCDGFSDEGGVGSGVSCGTNTITQGNECIPNLNAICGEGTFISGLQCLGLGIQAIGGVLVEISALAVIAAAIGVDPLITGLVVITMLGITGQAAWFIHRRKKNSNS